MSNPKPITFTVVPLGPANIPETENTISLAKVAQKAFKFVFRAETVPIQKDEYRLKNGALDLRKVVGDLLRQESFRRLASKQLILVTSEADSDPDSAREYTGKNLIEQCYFYHDSLPFDESVPYNESSRYAKKTAIISTYVWDNLPSIEEVTKTNSSTNRRALEPYLFLSFAMIALSRCIKMPLPHHMETRGCPFDYCDDVREIDRFFQGGRLCEECERFLEKSRRNGQITGEQLDSVKKLLLMAGGREYEYDVAISFAGPERELASQLSKIISEAGFKVFYDNSYTEDIIGKNVPEVLDEVFRRTSRFCVIFVSHEYGQRRWPKFEAESAKARALQEGRNDYIVPIVVEDSVVEDGSLSDLLKDTFRLSLATHSLEQIAEIVIGRLRRP